MVDREGLGTSVTDHGDGKATVAVSLDETSEDNVLRDDRVPKGAQ